MGAAERRGVAFVESIGDGWFMTFASVPAPAEALRRFVGFCRLKGFSGLHGVYEVLWQARS